MPVFLLFVYIYLFIYLFIYGIKAAKRNLAHIFSSFQTISYYNRHLCPLQIYSFTPEISLSIIELQWPEFLITRTY